MVDFPGRCLITFLQVLLLMRPEGPRQKALIPFKILTTLLYLDAPYIQHSPERTVLILGPYSRFMGVQGWRLRNHLVWLQSFGYISNLDLTYGKAFFKINKPQAFP